MPLVLPRWAIPSARLDAEPTDPPEATMYPDSAPVDEPVKKMAMGGSASSRADGCAERGKTRGMMR